MVRAMRCLAILGLTVFFGSCASNAVNSRLTRYDELGGYRYDNLSGDGNSDDLFVILAFSGGGTRAAAFSYGILEALRDASYQGPSATRRLLDDVDVISSVSGGSFTAAYYALFRERLFTDFEQIFLHRNVEDALLQRMLSPLNWFRLASPDFDRINLAAEFYDQEIFEKKTFGDLLEQPRKPFIILNATDMTLGQRFEFTQDQFDLLCSDLSRVKVATAVAASSAFPGLLSPLTLQNFAAEGCGYRAPPWLTDALDRERNPIARYTRARDLSSYQDPRQERNYIHLLDGGLADNIGLRGPYVALSSNDSGWNLFSRINRGAVSRVVVISVNAKTKPRKDWDRRKAAPGLLDVLGFVASGPMDNYSFDTVQLVRDLFDRQTEEATSWGQCKALLQERCPSATMPGELRSVNLHIIEISFDTLDDEKLRLCLENLPTSFSLPSPTVTLLRQTARFLLMRSAEFQRVMHTLDPSWQPPAFGIDSLLRAEACPG
jgi:NTE family protein